MVGSPHFLKTSALVAPGATTFEPHLKESADARGGNREKQKKMIAPLSKHFMTASLSTGLMTTVDSGGYFGLPCCRSEILRITMKFVGLQQVSWDRFKVSEKFKEDTGEKAGRNGAAGPEPRSVFSS
jgi:hypothetical protein